MPRQRVHHRCGEYYVFPDDFAQCLVRFKEASELPWAEIARRLGANPRTVRRWHNDGIRPNAHYLVGLQALARDLGLERLLPTIRVRRVPVYPGEPLPD